MKRFSCIASMTVVLVLAVGCVPFVGVPSTTLMTRSLPRDSASIERVGARVEETETMTWALVFLVFGRRPTHESVVARLLEKHDADVLLDAEVTSSQFGLPYLFFQMNTTAKGQPARYKNRGQ